MKQKVHGRKGFTLAETLLALLILMMVSTIVATGIPAAKNAYEGVVLASNAEVLLSTTAAALRNELGTSGDIAVAADGKSVTYYNAVRETYSKIFLDKVSEKEGAGNTIFLLRYARVEGIGKDVDTKERLVSAATATDDLYVAYSAVSYDESKNLITFSGLSVNRESGAVGLAARDSLSIHVMQY